MPGDQRLSPDFGTLFPSSSTAERIAPRGVEALALSIVEAPLRQRRSLFEIFYGLHALGSWPLSIDDQFVNLMYRPASLTNSE